ncbi:MAG TPA: 2-isopropylmalate synthase, partial [Spirochaetia bacterium]|nr:2-isopropylmalate synthase [Spirochaetia bacterium]
MSNVIKIFDTTLRDGEQSPGAAMNALQKLEVAKALDRMGVDIIEAGFPVSSKEQMEGVRLISETVTNSIVVGLARCVKGDVDAVYEATKSAKKRMLHIFIATSPIHMEFKLRKKPDEVLATIDEMIRYSKKYFD